MGTLEVGQEVFCGVGSLRSLPLAATPCFWGAATPCFWGDRQILGGSAFLINLLTFNGEGDLGGGVFFSWGRRTLVMEGKGVFGLFLKELWDVFIEERFIVLTGKRERRDGGGEDVKELFFQLIVHPLAVELDEGGAELEFHAIKILLYADQPVNKYIYRL